MTAQSLHSRLTWLIFLVLALVLVPFSVGSFLRTEREMNALADGRLAQAAHTLSALIAYNQSQLPQAALITRVVPSPLTPNLKSPSGTITVDRQNFEPEVGFQIYSQHGRLLVATANLAQLAAPPPGASGFENTRLDDQRWRVYNLQSHTGLLIRMGERFQTRQDVRRALLIEHGLPLLLGLPLLALLIRWAVRQGLAPLDALTRLLAERTPGSRQPVTMLRTTPELAPLVDTLNQQLSRLEDALEREHRFNADVAHELRTPLAATMIHLESAAGSSDAGEVGFALSSAQHSLARLARRIEQLLALARLEAGAASEQRARLDLVSIATEVIEEFAPLIAERDIAFSLRHELPQLWYEGHEIALSSMIRNLVENALRYVAAGGQVELALQQLSSQIQIDVNDDGPGIPAARREQVFRRFRRETADRSDGYGLGLDIVLRAVQLHGARIDLLDSPFGRGLRVRVLLPLTAGH